MTDLRDIMGPVENGGEGRRVQWRHRAELVFLEDTWVDNFPGCMYLWSSIQAAGGEWFPVPPELLAAFRAGEDWRPVADWLIEAYPDRLGWLAQAAAEGAGT